MSVVLVVDRWMNQISSSLTVLQANIAESNLLTDKYTHYSQQRDKHRSMRTRSGKKKMSQTS